MIPFELLFSNKDMTSSLKQFFVKIYRFLRNLIKKIVKKLAKKNLPNPSTWVVDLINVPMVNILIFDIASVVC